MLNDRLIKLRLKDSFNKEKILNIKTRKKDPLKPYQYINKGNRKLKKNINYGALFYLGVDFKTSKANLDLTKNSELK